MAVLVALAACTSGASSPAGGAPDSSGRSSSAADDSFGSLPTYLPKDTVRPNGPLVGTMGRAALQVQGAPVLVRLAAASLRAEVDGPQVPDEGTPYEPDITVATWTVTMSNATHALPLRLRDFTVLDDEGKVHVVKAVAHEAQPPATIPAGRRVSFAIRSVVPTGEGLVRWAPAGGPVVASWDFVAETD